MKIVISYYKDGTIKSVRSFEAFLEKGKSEREILEQIEERNDHYGYERFKVECIPDNLKELFAFVLGVDRYKAYAEADTIGTEIKKVASDVNDVGGKLVGISEMLERIEKRYELINVELSKMQRE